MERYGYPPPPSASLGEKWVGKALGFIAGTQRMGGKGHFHEPKLQRAQPCPPCPIQSGDICPCPHLPWATLQDWAGSHEISKPLNAPARQSALLLLI